MIYRTVSNSQARMYADTHLTFFNNDFTNLEQGLNEDLAKVNKWLIANKLALKKSKTKFMFLGFRQS